MKTCEKGFTLEGEKCVKRACAKDFKLQADGQCKRESCPEGFTFKYNRCYAACQKDFGFVKGKCVR